jgi:hypothetical protein
MRVVAVNTIQKKHVKMDIEVEGAPKTLDQGHRAVYLR